jgi:hypothetical protein
MQLTPLVTDVEEAKERLAEYSKLAADERTAEDERIKAGYRAAARGMPVISLAEAVTAGGHFDNGLPRIAVVRADSQKCWIHVENETSQRHALIFSRHPEGENRGALVGIDTVRVSVPRDLGFNGNGRYWNRASTIVPIIPPEHRPKRRRLHRFHILWEVESWTLEAPRDPALLKWIGGDLWAVVAAWDLSELERHVLAGRR